MGRERDEQISPDLFSAAAVGDTPPPQPKPTATDTTAERMPVRHLLPNDLRKAIKHLSDGELDTLHAAEPIRKTLWGHRMAESKSAELGD